MKRLLPMTYKDFEYLERRLLDPAPRLDESIIRLREMGRESDADELVDARRKLMDVTRSMRRDMMKERGILP